jgi:hypothetical protein
MGGLLPLRSYHQKGIAGRSAVAGNSNVMIELAGKLSKSWPVVRATTETGSRRPQAAKGTVSWWQAMSPSAPVPKSHQPRCANEW